LPLSRQPPEPKRKEHPLERSSLQVRGGEEATEHLPFFGDTQTMRRTYLILGVLAVGGLAFVGWRAIATTAETKVAARSVDNSARASLPLSHVVLFSSGVGYFQREGTVEGDTRVDMTFRVGDVNDLLKSMVLEDADDGRISAISYDSQEPVEKTLKSFALDLTYNPTLGQLLNQARGEKIEVTLQQAAAGQPAVMTGVIMGMESKQSPHGKEQVIETHLLNLVCAEGLRTVPLSQVQRLRFLNASLDAELHRALEVLAASHDSLKKVVSLNFKGEGKRRVKVGYVVENPLWKASYRLVLNGKDGKGPFLQGWALVENTGDEDWRDVKMSLVSGRPISFQMDLYQPLFIPRPTVEPERFASLRPPTYNAAVPGNNNPGMAGGALGGALGGAIGGFGGFGQNGGFNQFGFQGGMAGMNPFVNRYQLGNQFGFQGGFGNLGLGQFGMQGQIGGQGGNGDNNLSNGLANNRLTYEQLQQRRKEQQVVRANARRLGSSIAALDPAGGVASIASAEEIGDSFRYTIDDKVNLPRQKSAMLPVVHKGIEASRVSIYNEGVHPKFPLLGLRFKNTTGQNLMQGPVTVYEGGAYAGDARIMDLQPDEERLLSYAIDLGSEVKTSAKDAPEQLMSVKVVKGIVQATHKLRETKTYRIVNRSKHDRVMIVEHPVRNDWKLMEPAKPTEQSRDVYRFEVKVAAGKNAELKVIEEQMRKTALALSSTDDKVVRLFQVSQITSPKVKDALKKAIDLRTQQATVKRDLAHLEKQLKGITEDQTRLRANLERLPPTSAAHKRYLTKFDTQETQIEKLQAQIQQKQEEEKQRQKEYEEYLTNLTIE
jgi:hypothetical protein